MIRVEIAGGGRLGRLGPITSRSCLGFERVELRLSYSYIEL